MSETRKYLSKINKGGLTVYVKDLEARESLAGISSTYATKTEMTAATIIPIDIENMTPTMTFEKNSILGINGIMFRAVVDTDEFPVVLLVQDGHIVYDEDENGNKAFVVSDWTQSEDWEIWTDASIPRTLQLMTQQQETFMAAERADMAAFKQEIRNDAAQLIVLAAQSIKPGTKITSTGGTQYTVEELLVAVADLMNKKVLADPIE